jgi:hypothetical protein
MRSVQSIRWIDSAHSRGTGSIYDFNLAQPGHHQKGEAAQGAVSRFFTGSSIGAGPRQRDSDAGTVGRFTVIGDRPGTRQCGGEVVLDA